MCEIGSYKLTKLMKNGVEVTLSAPDFNRIKVKNNILTVDPYLRIDGDHTVEIEATSGEYRVQTLVTILSPPLPGAALINFPPTIEGETAIIIEDSLRFEFPVIDEDVVDIDSVTF